MLIETQLPLYAARYIDDTRRDDDGSQLLVRLDVVRPGDHRLVPPTKAQDGKLVLHWLEPEDQPEDVVTVHQVSEDDFAVSYAGRRARLSFHRGERAAQVLIEDTDDDLVGTQTIAEGWLLALVISLWGKTVLHASAVQLNNKVVAFVGPSGQGKSTLSALAAVGGAALFADDVLRVDSNGGLVLAHRGATSLRLRDDAVEAGHLQHLGLRNRVDGRTMFAPLSAPDAYASLSAIVFPHRDDQAAGISIQHLDPSEGAVSLLGGQRVFHWVDPQLRVSTFDAFMSLAIQVPLYRLTAARHSVSADGLIESLSSIGFQL
jgi:hypothetical protein